MLFRSLDCKEAKEFLSQHGIQYTEYDVSKEPGYEEIMKKRTGSIIVPAFIIKNRGVAGLIKKPQIYIGFHVNREDIANALQINNE